MRAAHLLLISDAAVDSFGSMGSERLPETLSLDSARLLAWTLVSPGPRFADVRSRGERNYGFPLAGNVGQAVRPASNFVWYRLRYLSPAVAALRPRRNFSKGSVDILKLCGEALLVKERGFPLTENAGHAVAGKRFFWCPDSIRTPRAVADPQSHACGAGDTDASNRKVSPAFLKAEKIKRSRK